MKKLSLILSFLFPFVAFGQAVIPQGDSSTLNINKGGYQVKNFIQFPELQQPWYGRWSDIIRQGNLLYWFNPVDSTYKPIGNDTSKIGWNDTLDKIATKTDLLAQKSVYNILSKVTPNDSIGDADSINAAFQYAKDNGYAAVYIPAGHYIIDRQIIIPPNLKIFGDGIDQTILDASQADFTNDTLFPSALVKASILKDIFLVEGKIDYLGKIKDEVNTNDKYVISDSILNLDLGDIIILQNQKEYSYSTETSRPYYKSGEIVIVSDSVVNDTVKIQNNIVGSNYTTDSTILGLLNYNTTDISGFTIIGNPIDSSDNIPLNTVGLEVASLVNPRVSNIKIYGFSNSQIRISNSLNGRIDKIIGGKNQENLRTTWGVTGYGITVGNSQGVDITNCILNSVQHAITTSNGLDTTWRIANRYVNITNSVLSTRGNFPSILLHGNTELSNISNNYIEGVTLQGQKNILSNNNIYTNEYWNYAIIVSSCISPDFDIYGNNVYGYAYDDNSVGLYFNPTYVCKSPGTLNIHDNNFHAITTSDDRFIYADNEASINGINVNFINNRVIVDSPIYTKRTYISIDGGAGLLNNVNVSNNTLKSIGLAISKANKAVERDNQIDSTYSLSLQVNNSKVAIIEGNIITNSNLVSREESTNPSSIAFGCTIFSNGNDSAFINNNISSSLENEYNIYATGTNNLFLGSVNFNNDKPDSITTGTNVFPYKYYGIPTWSDTLDKIVTQGWVNAQGYLTDTPDMQTVTDQGATTSNPITFTGGGNGSTAFANGNGFGITSPSSSGWARGLNAYKSDGTSVLGGMGFYGTAGDAVRYGYLSSQSTTYNKPDIKYINGSVGINITGTDLPTATLDVNGNGRFRVISNSTGDFVTADANGFMGRRTTSQVITDLGLPDTLSNYVSTSKLGAQNGVATLNNNLKLTATQLPINFGTITHISSGNETEVMAITGVVDSGMILANVWGLNEKARATPIISITISGTTVNVLLDTSGTSSGDQLQFGYEVK